MNDEQYAPGWPGIPPRWTSSAKTGVGTAINSRSRAWFTLSHGILDEVYYPRLDWACTRDMEFIVTDGKDFFSEEKRHTHSQVEYLEEGVPAYRLTNVSQEGRYRIEKEIIADPRRPVVLQRVRFVPLQGKLEDYHLYALLAPHLGNQGYGNNAWVGDYKGQAMLFAEREGQAALALASSTAWLGCSAGFVGASDGYQQLTRDGHLATLYARAENGNVALTGEIDLQACAGSFVLALGFDEHAFAAAHHARASLFDGFDAAFEQYVAEWKGFQHSLLALDDEEKGESDNYRISAAVLRTHEAKHFRGGLIASLSIPWGFNKSDNDLGGYHLVWARDLVETVGGLMAAGAHHEARRVLRYLQVTQESDGHWPQNMWLDGTPYWSGVQLDETGFPILLAEQAWREGMLETDQLAGLWPMIRRAASYMVIRGPRTGQDRWEENPGYTPFTLAVEISAMLAAAEIADLVHETTIANYLRETADAWNDSIERWTYAAGTPLAQQIGVKGYYVRIAPPDTLEDPTTVDGTVTVKNRPTGEAEIPADELVSPDALALVRFGLRAPDDPRILDTVKVIDALLKVETPYGPSWHRYNNDGYGEQEDGSPFDGTGIGRAWPLLTGERAHYELAAGHEEEARRLLHAMEAFASSGGMLPEQVWDAPDIPERELFCGRPSGSAMPLVWAHAEYIKLRRSLREKRVFDLPPHPVQRYIVEQRKSNLFVWGFNHKIPTMPARQKLRLEVRAPAIVHWSADGWKTTHDTPTWPTGLGVHVADLPTERLSAGETVTFTFHWTEVDRWEGTDFEVKIEPPKVTAQGNG
ncbi:MAG TPA: glucan 1,4-alpha-glucosidase [Herpetosiphonaceae bacterium]|nr:glucan 1,4-alpha-glucosidase [Herpetosiphonaceae bacterium]